MTKHIAFCVVMVFVFGTIMTVSADVPKDLMIYLIFHLHYTWLDVASKSRQDLEDEFVYYLFSINNL